MMYVLTPPPSGNRVFILLNNEKSPLSLKFCGSNSFNTFRNDGDDGY